MKNNRYLGAVLLSPFVIFLFLGGPYLKYGVMLLSILGMFELYKIVREKGIHTINALGYIMCLIYYIYLDKNLSSGLILYVIIGCLLLLMCIPVLDVKFNFIDISVTIFGFLYVAVFFSFIPLIDSKENGNLLIWLVFISSWLCDTSAYYVGRFFGKTKLCPKVSPKKTVEGAIGGLVGSALSCGVYGFILSKMGLHIPIYNFFIIGLLCGIFCQFGDLTASSIKRFVGVKDYSNLIPGHGGILDRFDSILFASVVVYYYITFIIGI